MFTSKRKEAYLRKHPETGKPGPRGDNCGEVRHNSFADDQAEKTGTSARTVRQNAERGKKVTPAALAMVKGTSLHDPYAWRSTDSLLPDADFCFLASRRADSGQMTSCAKSGDKSGDKAKIPLKGPI